MKPITRLAFLGVQPGLTFTVDDLNATAGDLLGGIVFGAPQLGEDILPEIGMLPGASGFTPPLGPGDYTFWVNQTGPPNESTLVFVGQREAGTGVGPSDPIAVPTLGPVGFILLAGLAGLLGVVRLRA
ncbi:MAG: IPTL-CTERM sorting domain-containing protein [Pseudomonadota bacterium]